MMTSRRYSVSLARSLEGERLVACAVRTPCVGMGCVALRFKRRLDEYRLIASSGGE